MGPNEAAMGGVGVITDRHEPDGSGDGFAVVDDVFASCHDLLVAQQLVGKLGHVTLFVSHVKQVVLFGIDHGSSVGFAIGPGLVADELKEVTVGFEEVSPCAAIRRIRFWVMADNSCAYYLV